MGFKNSKIEELKKKEKEKKKQELRKGFAWARHILIMIF